jgi:diadenosine tetraphosphate (Ap4A) HIT family hydrolase
MKSKCIFCELAGDEQIVFETPYFRLVKNKYPAIKTHYLLISREHITKESDMNRSCWVDYYEASKKAYEFIEHATGNGPLVFINPPHMQSVGHFHKHYLAGVFGIHGVAKALNQYLKNFDSTNKEL